MAREPDSIVDKRIITDKQIEEIAKQLLPRNKVFRLRSGRQLKANAYVWNQALMDYAAAVLKDKKIPLPKQSAFKSSNRYYRGYIMKALVQRHSISKAEVWEYFNQHNPIEKPRLEIIIMQMQKDGLVELWG